MSVVIVLVILWAVMFTMHLSNIAYCRQTRDLVRRLDLILLEHLKSHCSVDQLVDQGTVNAPVVGSSPTRAAT